VTVSIVLVDRCTAGTIADIETLTTVAAALQRQVGEDFLPRWLVDATVRAATPTRPPLADEWMLGLYETPEHADALGEHDTTPAGLPLMRVYPKLDAADLIPWTVTASHEILETLADPWLCRCAQGRDGRIWALEICDAVEQDFYWIDGIAVSDFVYPAYFEPPRELDGVVLDHMRLLTAPLELRPGGYGQTWTDEAGAGWTTTLGPGTIRVGRMAMGKSGRGSRRARSV
jgi:hypothetical protein